MSKERDYKWRFIEGTSQQDALDCPAHHILYHGTRGPGKTDTQLIRFYRNVGKGYGTYWRGVIFDQEYKNLDDMIAKSKRIFYNMDDGAKFLSSNSDYKWVWPTGEELLFRHIKRKDDYWNFHGQEFPFIGWNELTKYATPDLYDMMMSCNRSSFVPEKNVKWIDKAEYLKEGRIVFVAQGENALRYMPDPIPLEVFSTTNPYGAGRPWVKRRFIDQSENGKLHRVSADVFNPRTKNTETITKYQAHIFGSYTENIYLTPEYIVELQNITDRNRRKAWLEGDWNVISGGAFDDVWSDAMVVPRFKVPANWHVDRAFDWGSSHPFSVGWYAEANGEEVILEDGRVFAPVAGSIIKIAEWYGTAEIGTNKGLRMSSVQIAEGIKRREASMLAAGWIQKLPEDGPADNQIYDVRESDVESIAKKMQDEGVYWTKSVKSAGSRANGFQLVRDRMHAVKTGDGAGLYFMRNCAASIELIPSLPREDDMDDVDTDAEDHTYDELRYRVLAGNNRLATSLDVGFVR